MSEIEVRTKLGQRPTQTERSWPEARAAILKRYIELLEEVDSPLLSAGREVRGQVEAQLLGVVDAVARQVDPLRSEVELDGVDLSELIGRHRADAGIHPSQSLQAASMIFEAALPFIAGFVEPREGESAELVAGVVLNREILARMAAAARAYVDYLLDKAHATNRDERRRLSRELHDVAAPAIAVAIHNLELWDIYAETEQAKALIKIEAARTSMFEALAVIRTLAAASRENVASKGLEEALRRFLATAPSTIRCNLSVVGAVQRLTLAQAEELFLLVREAVRNAVTHANPNVIDVGVAIEPAEVRATVRDDGAGFDIAMLNSPGHVGIDAMHERAQLLGGTLSIQSRIGNGTTVSVRIPLAAERTMVGGAAQ